MIYQVIIDTNFFLLPFQLNIDIFSEFERILEVNYEPILLNEIYNELLKLKEKSKLKKNVEGAIKLSERCKKIDFNLLDNEKIDDSIIRYAVSNRCIVATNDKDLIKKLKKQGIPIIQTRKKKYLKLVGILK
ncbi:MAG: PIN domain-containing protein [Candidatus Helarchaeota archaeon]